MKNDLIFPVFNLLLQIEKRHRFSICSNKIKNGLVFQFVATVPYLDLLQVRFNVLGRGVRGPCIFRPFNFQFVAKKMKIKKSPRFPDFLM